MSNLIFTTKKRYFIFERSESGKLKHPRDHAIDFYMFNQYGGYESEEAALEAIRTYMASEKGYYARSFEFSCDYFIVPQITVTCEGENA